MNELPSSPLGSRDRSVRLARACLIIFGSLWCAAGALVQDTTPGALRVRVIDQDWDVPLAEATVQVLEAEKKQLTAEDGNVLFDMLPGGSYTLVISAPGFERKVLNHVVVIPGEAKLEEVRLNGAFVDMDEFVVKDIDLGGGGSTLQLLEIRSQHSGLMDAVGADMMSKAGAGTAAAALKMVTGATVQDGKYAVIRGLGDRYTATLVNGVRMPTADKDKRAVHMDQFPSSIIESIQVTKTFMPDQQGDASGGINIITKSVPDGPVLSMSVSTEYDSNATGQNDFKTYRGGGNDFDGMRGVGSLRFWDSSSMGNPRGTHSVPGKEGEKRKTVADEKYSSAIKSKSPPGNYGFKFAVGDAADVGEWRLGGLLTGSYSQKYKYRNGYKFGMMPNQSARETAPLKGEGAKTYVETSTDEQLWSMGLTLGAKNELNEIKFTGIYSHQSLDVVDIRHGPKSEMSTTIDELSIGRGSRKKTYGESQSDSRTRTFSSIMQYTENANGSLQLTGKHTLPWLNDAELDWTGAYNMAESIEPDRRRITGSYVYHRDIVRHYADVVGTLTPSQLQQIRAEQDVEQSKWVIDSFERRWQDTREDAWQGQANLKVPFTVLENEGYAKGGVFGDFMDRTYRNRVYEIDVPATMTLDAVNEYDYRSFGKLDGLDLPENLTPASIEYDGRQDLTAYYCMLKAPLPEWLELVGGARVESTLMETTVKSPLSDKIVLNYLITEQNAQNDFERANVGRIGARSNVEPKEADAEIDQVDVLPAISLNVKPLEDFSLRLTYGKTIARPTFKEITPVLYQDYDASQVFLGNPDLVMSELDNYDARVEWRPGNATDLIAASVFYKTISDPIQYSTRRDTGAGSLDYIYPENYGDAEIKGLEFEMRKGLGFIWSELSPFSVGGNLTLQDSEVKYPKDIRAKLLKAEVRDDSRPMDGQSEILGNVNLMFEDVGTGLSVDLFYNLKGETYVSGDTATDDTYVPSIVEKPVGTLDLIIGLKFAKVWRLGVEIKNLLNPEIETVYRTPYRDIPNTRYKIGRIYGLSLGCDW